MRLERQSGLRSMHIYLTNGNREALNVSERGSFVAGTRFGCGM